MPLQSAGGDLPSIFFQLPIFMEASIHHFFLKVEYILWESTTYNHIMNFTIRIFRDELEGCSKFFRKSLRSYQAQLLWKTRDLFGTLKVRVMPFRGLEPSCTVGLLTAGLWRFWGTKKWWNTSQCWWAASRQSSNLPRLFKIQRFRATILETNRFLAKSQDL